MTDQNASQSQLTKLTPINKVELPPSSDIEESSSQDHQEPVTTSKILRPMKEKPTKTNPIAMTLAALVIVLAGTLTGFGVSKLYGSQAEALKDAPSNTGSDLSETKIAVGDTFGATSSEGCVDEAQGVLQAGGIEGEGSHHLARPGGVVKNVYLTSSTVDLSSLVDHEVKVCGETFAAQKAGWLMDVVRVEVLALNAPLPTE